MSEFCYLFNPSFRDFPYWYQYPIDMSDEKECTHALSFDNWGPDELHLSLSSNEPWLYEDDPTMLRLTIVNNSRNGQRIILRDMVLPWLIEFDDSEYKYIVHPGESITLQTVINDITNKKSWWPIEPVNPEYYTEPM